MYKFYYDEPMRMDKATLVGLVPQTLEALRELHGKFPEEGYDYMAECLERSFGYVQSGPKVTSAFAQAIKNDDSPSRGFDI